MLKRRCLKFLTVIPLLVLLAVPAVADGQDEGYSPTPTALADLLPEGGIDSVDIRFGIIGTFNQIDPPLPVYFYTTILGEDGRLVFRYINGSQNGEEKQRDKGVVIFNSDGLPVMHYSKNHGFVERTESLSAAVDDQLVTFLHRKLNDRIAIPPDDEEPPAFERREVSLRYPEGRVPIEWRPLAFAYHLRRGTERFVVRFCYTDNSGDRLSEYVQAVGTRTLEIEGEQVKATAVKIRTLDESEAGEAKWRDSDVIYLYATDGRVLGFEYPEKHAGLIFQRATPEQIVKQFKLQLADDHRDTNPEVMLPFEDE